MFGVEPAVVVGFAGGGGGGDGEVEGDAADGEVGGRGAVLGCVGGGGGEGVGEGDEGCGEGKGDEKRCGEDCWQREECEHDGEKGGLVTLLRAKDIDFVEERDGGSILHAGYSSPFTSSECCCYLTVRSVFGALLLPMTHTYGMVESSVCGV